VRWFLPYLSPHPAAQTIDMEASVRIVQIYAPALWICVKIRPLALQPTAPTPHALVLKVIFNAC